MAGNDPSRLARLQLLDRAQPAGQVAIEGRNVTREEEISEKPCARRLVEDREVGVGVRGRPGFDDEEPVPKFELALVGDQKGGQDDGRSGKGLSANQVLPGGDVSLLA